MKATIGKAGLDHSFQDEFPRTVECHYCAHHSALIAFVAHEGMDKKELDAIVAKKEPAVCFNRPATAEIWPHDLIACAVYICTSCGEATAIWNQG
jgi:hypothetical protein